MMKWPDCDTPERCEFSPTGPAFTTDMYYPPRYNRAGENLNPDGNVTSQEWSCSACEKRWIASTRLGEVEFTEIENA